MFYDDYDGPRLRCYKQDQLLFLFFTRINFYCLQVLAWILVVFILTFTKVSIASMLREKGKRALLWCGAFTQVGSLVGALAIFFILNFYKLFKQANLCT